MARIHIILASYNGENYIRRQLDSILQSKEDFCLHIFDDGSTDGTGEILREYRDSCPKRVRVTFHETNLGCTRNFLHGLQTVYDEVSGKRQVFFDDTKEDNASLVGKDAREPYFMFCDQDDIWHPNKLTLSYKAMRVLEKKYTASKPLLLFTDAVVADENGEEIAPSFLRQNKLNPYATGLAGILMENKCIGCSCVMNSALVTLLCELPGHARYHDWWMALLASSFGKLSFLNRKTLSYCQHGNNVVGVRRFSSYVKQRLLSLREQKKSLLATEQQAKEFLRIYEAVLPENTKSVIATFAGLSKESFLRRRLLLIRYGFFKTGVIRNLGLFLLI